ncbi:hypothetical protein, partial [Neisseria elongata]|uniref:hypothetical protein n=1 Tax=Neisseria elongata TaxID=495 RepID=UPI0028F0074B
MTHNQGKAENPQTAEGGGGANSFRLAIPCRTIFFNIKRSHAVEETFAKFLSPNSRNLNKDF